eukprot:185183-Prymnesium_polylepis.1
MTDNVCWHALHLISPAMCAIYYERAQLSAHDPAATIRVRGALVALIQRRVDVDVDPQVVTVECGAGVREVTCHPEPAVST